MGIRVRGGRTGPGGSVLYSAETTTFSLRWARLHLIGPSTGSPRPEGHLHCRPRLQVGLRTWAFREVSRGGHTRVRSWVHVRAHAASRYVAVAETQRPHPLRSRAKGDL